MDVRRFPRGQDALSENPAGSADPAQRAGREGGVCFFAPGFFAQAKKGGSRRHGAKALDVDLQPADEERSRAARCARPSSGASRHLLPQAGEGLAIGLPRAEEGCSGGSTRPSWFEEKASGRSHPYTITNPTVEGSRFTARPLQSADDERMVRPTRLLDRRARSEEHTYEHTSELQSLMRTSYAVFCLKKKTQLK